MLEYFDAIIGGRTMPFGIRPIDEVHQMLFDNRHKCIGTDYVAWDGNSGMARTELFGQKTFAIDCKGKCPGLRYFPVSGYTPAYHGGAQAVPYITIKHQMLGKLPIQWHFARPDNADPPPEVRIHMWTSTWGDYGGGCRLQ